MSSFKRRVYSLFLLLIHLGMALANSTVVPRFSNYLATYVNDFTKVSLYIQMLYLSNPSMHADYLYAIYAIYAFYHLNFYFSPDAPLAYHPHRCLIPLC